MIEPILKGKSALITRPDDSASELAQCLEAMGAKTSILPCIDIEAIQPDIHGKESIVELDRYQTVIVTSQYAAQYGLDYIKDYWPQYPIRQRWLAMGQKTAQILLDYDAPIILPETDHTSETILELPELNLPPGQQVLILKGEGGRNVLEDTLRERGMRVDSIAFYQRKCPSYDEHEINSKVHQFNPDFIIALSSETIQNLISLVGPNCSELENAKWIVPSDRVATFAQEQGFKLTYVPDNLRPISIVKLMARK